MRDPKSLMQGAFRFIAERSSLFHEPLGLTVETWRLMHEARHLMREPPRLIDDKTGVRVDFSQFPLSFQQGVPHV